MATPFFPSMSFSSQLKDCKVVLKEIFFSCGAEKLKMLNLIQDKTHTTDSHHTTEILLKTCAWKYVLFGGSQLDTTRW